MAANVDSPKRRSLRLQESRAAAGNGAASDSRTPEQPRPSGNAKRLSAEKRKDGSVGKRRSAERLRRDRDPTNGPPHEGKHADPGPNDTTPSTGRKGKRNSAKGAQSMQPDTKSGDSPHLPGGDHGRNKLPKRNRSSSTGKGEDTLLSPATNTSFGRETRSSRARTQEDSGASKAGKEEVLGASSVKDKGHHAGSKEQGSEGTGRTFKPRRSHDGSIADAETISNVSSTNASPRTKSGRTKRPEDPGAIKGATSSKEKIENSHLPDPNSQEASEDPGGTSSLGTSPQRAASSVDTNTSFSRKNRAGGPKSPTKSQDSVSGESVSSKEYKEAELTSRGATNVGPNNQMEEPLDYSMSGKNLRSTRSCVGENRAAMNERMEKAESMTDKGEGFRNAGENNPREKATTTRNLHDVSDRGHSATGSDTGEASRDYKVHGCSKQLLQEVLEMCTGICKEIVNNQPYLSEEQKQQHHKDFTWDFETAFQENIAINGLSWHEAPDKDSEPDIKILEDDLDDAIVETSMKRKRHPRKILSHFVKKLKTEREVLNQYKSVVNPEKLTLDPMIESRMKDLGATAATVSQNIHETKKALPIQLEKAEGFSQVLNLQPVLEESRLRKDIFQSRVVIEDISKSMPRVLDTTPTAHSPEDLTTPAHTLRKRQISSSQRRAYPLRSKRKISLDS